jgi:membrane protein
MPSRPRPTDSWPDRVRARLPGTIKVLLRTMRGDDIRLYAAGLAFYAFVSLLPLLVLVLWTLSLVLGDERTQRLADAVGRLAPDSLGADRALRQVADLGTRLGVVAVVTSLWPASAYGAGLERAFERLSPGGERKFEGLRGRALFFLVLLPLFVLGSLVGAYAGTIALGSSGIARVAGWATALITGFVGSAAGVVLIYRVFPPERLGWGRIARGTLVTAAGVSILSLPFAIYLRVGANFQEHYATSGLAGLVLLAVWLFLSNVLLLAGYKVAASR